MIEQKLTWNQLWGRSWPVVRWKWRDFFYIWQDNNSVIVRHSIMIYLFWICQLGKFYILTVLSVRTFLFHYNVFATKLIWGHWENLFNLKHNFCKISSEIKVSKIMIVTTEKLWTLALGKMENLIHCVWIIFFLNVFQKIISCLSRIIVTEIVEISELI